MTADLERLAFALFAADFHTPEDLSEAPRIWGEVQTVYTEDAARFRTQVRAVLTELLNPSEGMVRAAQIAHSTFGQRGHLKAEPPSSGSVIAALTAMIGHVLADGGEAP